MALFENHLGLNLTTDKLQLVEVVYKDQNFYLENVDEERLTKSILGNLQKSDIVNILQNSFQNIINRKKLQSKNISFSLSHDFFKIAQIPYESTLLKQDLTEYIKFEFGVLFADCIPDDFLIRHYEISKDETLNKSSAIIIGIEKKIVHAIHQFCSGNGFILKNVDNLHVASNSFIILDNRTARREIYCSILVDGNYISLIVLDDKNPVYFKVKKIQNDQLIIPQVRSELSKLSKIGLSLKSIHKYYIGGDLADDLFITKFREETNFILIRYNPLDKIKVSSHIFENEYFIDHYHCFTAAAGMALRMI